MLRIAVAQGECAGGSHICDGYRCVKGTIKIIGDEVNLDARGLATQPNTLNFCRFNVKDPG